MTQEMDFNIEENRLKKNKINKSLFNIDKVIQSNYKKEI